LRRSGLIFSQRRKVFDMDSSTRLKPLLAQRKLPPSTFCFRAAFTTAYAHLQRQRPPTPGDVRDLFGDDDTVTSLLIPKAATTPNTTTTAGAELAAGSLADVLVGIGPVSAAASLINLGTLVNFPEGVATVGVPSASLTAFDGGAFVAEGFPIPARQYTITGLNLTLRKLACIVEMTEELAMYSNFEPIVRSLISKALGLKLDQAMFGTQADDGSTTR
jgi:hypothetical protein